MNQNNSLPKPNLYLAAPLFSDAERSYNVYLKQALSEHFDVYLPQEDGALMPDLLKSEKTVDQAVSIVFKNDINAIKQCDVLLILLDGRSIDEGAAFELGVAYTLKKDCVALQTDFRRLAPFGNNPMISGALHKTFTSIQDVLSWSSGYVAKARLVQLNRGDD